MLLTLDDVSPGVANFVLFGLFLNRGTSERLALRREKAAGSALKLLPIPGASLCSVLIMSLEDKAAGMIFESRPCLGVSPIRARTNALAD
jgi:hypothetical protein